VDKRGEECGPIVHIFVIASLEAAAHDPSALHDSIHATRIAKAIETPIN
jgi:hypothetical protein